MQRRLDLLEALLHERDYLFGEFGAADCIAWPFLRYAVHIEPGDDEEFHHVLHERLDVSCRTRLAAWIDRIAQRPQASRA